MNVFAKFDDIPSMILQNIKETKRDGHTHGRTDNVKTVYPPTNTVCGGYKYVMQVLICYIICLVLTTYSTNHFCFGYGFDAIR